MERTEFRGVGLTGGKRNRPRVTNRQGSSFFTQQLARNVRGGFAEVTTPSAAPAAASGAADIRAFVFAASPIVAEGFRQARRGSARHRARTDSLARSINRCAATWVTGSARAGRRQPQPGVRGGADSAFGSCGPAGALGGRMLVRHTVRRVGARVRPRARAPVGDARRGAPLRSVAVDRLGPALRAPRPDPLSQRGCHNLRRRPGRCRRGRHGGPAAQALGQ
jgi:hypothetical protein